MKHGFIKGPPKSAINTFRVGVPMPWQPRRPAAWWTSIREVSGFVALVTSVEQVGACRCPSDTKKEHLNSSKRSAVIDELLGGTNRAVLRKGNLTEMFSTTRQTTGRLGTSHQKQKADGVQNPDFACGRKGNSWPQAAGLAPRTSRVSRPPHSRCEQLRAQSRRQIGMELSTFHLHLRDLGLKRHKNYLKPLRTAEG